MLDGLVNRVKFVMFSAIGVIFVGGLVVFLLGVWTLADRAFNQRLLASSLHVVSASMLVTAGVTAVIISYVGSRGAYKENRRMLLTFLFVLLFAFVLALIGSVLAYAFIKQVDVRMYNEMKSTLIMYKNDTAITDAWDSVQKNFKCCGMSLDGRSSSFAYRNLNKHFSSANLVPQSCCKNPNDRNLLNQCITAVTTEQRYNDDCYEEMKTFVSRRASLIGWLGVSIACALVIGMVLSCALYLTINN